MKVAVVCDDLIQRGGQESLVSVVMEALPDAHLYTSISSNYWADYYSDRKISLITSTINNFPFISSIYKILAPLGVYHLIFGGFDLNGYEVVLSISSRYAHLVRVKPPTKHVVYINSPARFLWQSWYYKSSGVLNYLLAPLKCFLRILDFTSMKRADVLLSNSKNIRNYVKKIYRANSEILYPCYMSPSDIKINNSNHKYYVLVTRLVKWKKIEIAIEAFSKLNKSLVILGEGDRQYVKFLKSISQRNIQFKGYVSDMEKFKWISGASAFIMTQKEDFGIAPLEALSFGIPVVAFGKGGVLETVKDGFNGIFFDSQTSDSLILALKRLQNIDFDSKEIIDSTKPFRKENFVAELKRIVNEL